MERTGLHLSRFIKSNEPVFIEHCAVRFCLATKPSKAKRHSLRRMRLVKTPSAAIGMILANTTQGRNQAQASQKPGIVLYVSAWRQRQAGRLGHSLRRMRLVKTPSAAIGMILANTTKSRNSVNLRLGYSMIEIRSPKDLVNYGNN